MKKLLTGVLAATVFGAAVSASVLPRQAKTGDLSVTVAYTGKAKVDDTHEVWVFLFDNPNIGPGATPIARQAIKKSGAAAVFKAVPADTVYVAVAYDEKGDYDGMSGPPPTGAPISLYSTDGKGTPAPVKTAGGAKIKLSFGDERRMQ